jgi:hypothetical protein
VNPGAKAAAVALVVCSSLVLFACAPKPTATSTDPALSRQLEGLEALLTRVDPMVLPEPSGEATDGVYIARVVEVSPTPQLAVSLDWLTDRRGLGNASNTANSVAGTQTLPVSDAVIALPGSTSTYSVVAPDTLAARWRSEGSAHDTAYFVSVTNGKVVAMWPVNAPRSLP